jgi:hypothetical protein
VKSFKQPKIVEILRVHDVPICAITVSDCGQFVGLGSPDGITSIWKLNYSPKLQNICKSSGSVHGLPTTSAMFMYDPKSKEKAPTALLTGSADCSVYILKNQSDSKYLMFLIIILFIVAIVMVQQ